MRRALSIAVPLLIVASSAPAQQLSSAWSKANGSFTSTVTGSPLFTNPQSGAQSSDPTSVYGPLAVIVGTQGAMNAGYFSSYNNTAAGTVAFPTAVTAHGELRSAGGQSFGYYGEAVGYTPGVFTHELDPFNRTGQDAPSVYPWNRGFGTTQSIGVGLTCAAGGTNIDAACMEIGREGSSHSQFQFGGVVQKDAVLQADWLFDADATNSAVNNIVARNTGQGAHVPIVVQIMGAMVAKNAILSSQDATGVEHFRLNQDGSIVGGNIASTSPAQTSQTYAGQTVLTGLDYNLTAMSSTTAEQTVVFRMYSNTGAGASAVTGYKMAFGAEMTAGAGSAPVFAGTMALTTQPGYLTLTQSQVVLEGNGNNNSGTDCANVNIGVGGVPCGTFFAAGSGSNKMLFGYGVGGNNQNLYGFASFTGGAILSSFRSWDAAQVGFQDAGSHINGFDGQSATYSGSFIIGPGGLFTVSPAGTVQGTGYTASNNSTSNVSAFAARNSNATNVTTKTVSYDFQGVDTASTQKTIGQIIAVPEDSNHADDDLQLSLRRGDQISLGALFSATRGTILPKLATAPSVAPGAGQVAIYPVAGSTAGTCKLVMLAGTSTTPVTIVDNVGLGC